MSYVPQPAMIPQQYAQQGAMQPQYAPLPPQQQYAPPQTYQYPQPQGQPYPPVPPMPPQYPPGYAQGHPLPPHLQPHQQQYHPQFNQTGYYNPAIPPVAPNDGFYTVRVIGGTHRGTRCIFKTGDVFRTRDPLHLMFENKFQLVPDTPTIIEDSANIPERMIPKTPQEVAAARQRAQMQQHGTTPQSIQSPVMIHSPPPIDERAEELMFPFAESENVSKRFPKAKKASMEIWHHKEKGYAINTFDPQYPEERFNIADVELTSVAEVNKYLAEMGL